MKCHEKGRKTGGIKNISWWDERAVRLDARGLSEPRSEDAAWAWPWAPARREALQAARRGPSGSRSAKSGRASQSLLRPQDQLGIGYRELGQGQKACVCHI